MEKLANRLAAWLIRSGSEEDQDVLAYGILAVLYEIFVNAILLVLAVFLRLVPEYIAWTVAYIPLRRNMGGLHTATPLSCFLVSLLLGGAALMLVELFVPFIWVLGVEIVFTIAVAFILAPVIHENHPVSDIQYNNARRKSRLYAVLFGLGSAVAVVVGFEVVGHAVGVSIFTAAVLCVLGRIRGCGRRV